MFTHHACRPMSLLKSATISLYHFCNILISAVCSYSVFLLMDTATNGNTLYMNLSPFSPSMPHSPVLTNIMSHSVGASLFCKVYPHSLQLSVILGISETPIPSLEYARSYFSKPFSFPLRSSSPDRFGRQISHRSLLPQLGYSNMYVIQRLNYELGIASYCSSSASFCKRVKKRGRC